MFDLLNGKSLSLGYTCSWKGQFEKNKKLESLTWNWKSGWNWKEQLKLESDWWSWKVFKKKFAIFARFLPTSIGSYQLKQKLSSQLLSETFQLLVFEAFESMKVFFCELNLQLACMIHLYVIPVIHDRHSITWSIHDDILGFVIPMVMLSLPPHVEFEPNDHREDAPHFTSQFLHDLNL